MSIVATGRHAVRERAIWPVFLYSAPFTVSQAEERTIIIGLYASSYNNQSAYLLDIETVDLANLLNDYNARISSLTTDEQIIVSKIVVDRYIANLDKAIKDNKNLTMQAKIDSETVEMDAREAALEIDRAALTTLIAKIETERNLTEARIAVLQAEIAEETTRGNLIDVEISEKNIDLSNVDIRKTETKVQLAETDLQIAEIPTKAAAKQIEIIEEGIQTSKTNLQISEVDITKAKIGVETAETNIRIGEIELQTIEARLTVSETDVRTAETNLRISEANIQKSEIDLQAAEVALKELQVSFEIAKIQLKVIEAGMEFTETEVREAELQEKIARIGNEIIRVDFSASDLAMEQTQTTISEAEVSIAENEEVIAEGKLGAVTTTQAAYMEAQADVIANIEKKTLAISLQQKAAIETLEAQKTVNALRNRWKTQLSGLDKSTSALEDSVRDATTDASGTIKDSRISIAVADMNSAISVAEKLAQAKVIRTSLTHTIGAA